MTDFLIQLIVIFTISFVLAALFIRGRYSKKATDISEILDKFAIPMQTTGYLSGHTIFSSGHALLANKLIFVSLKNPDEVTQIAYKDITTITLKGWLFLRVHITTHSGEFIDVSPVTRFTVSRLDKAALDAYAKYNAKVTAKNPGSESFELDRTFAAYENDTAGSYYLRYGALFKHFYDELLSQ